MGLLFPRSFDILHTMPRAMTEAYEFHRKLYARPGFPEMMRKLEREDWLTLPAMLAATPFDLQRIRNKYASGKRRLKVTPPDDFPYPDYYLNDFHNQKNGHLSLQSALTYEWQISVLFFNANRLMRQGIVDHIPEGSGLEILDVACGTAAWIPQAHMQRRKHHVVGVDLSPAYLQVARMAQRLGFRPGAEFLQMNAESLRPEWEGRFDIVTSIWLLHEMPRRPAQRAIGEMVRVLKPGGRLLIMDSLQLRDAVPERQADMDQVHHFFARFFNEPYYLTYQQLDIPELLRSHGLLVECSENWLRSKLWVARKPPL
jgi:ubiquinone/menaquinone biosynthesis C-methylase UbiE